MLFGSRNNGTYPCLISGFVLHALIHFPQKTCYFEIFLKIFATQAMSPGGRVVRDSDGRYEQSANTYSLSGTRGEVSNSSFNAASTNPGIGGVFAQFFGSGSGGASAAKSRDDSGNSGSSNSRGSRDSRSSDGAGSGGTQGLKTFLCLNFLICIMQK